MSFNLLDAVKGHFNNEFVTQAASFLGESEGGVSKALSSALPSLLTGLASKASSSQGATDIAAMASEANNSGILGNISSLFGGGSVINEAAEMVKGLFGQKFDDLIDGIASFSGLKSGSASNLLSMAAPVVLGTLGKHSADNNLGASGLASLLSSQSSSWSSLLPGNLGNLLGGLGSVAAGVGGAVTGAASSITGGIGKVAGGLSSGLGSAASSVGSVASSVGNLADDAADTAKGGITWLLPMLVLISLGFLGYYLVSQSGCGKGGAAHTDGAVTVSAGTNTSADTTNKAGASAAAALPKISIDSLTGIVKYDLGKAIDIELPNNTKLTNVAERGFEANLVNFLKTETVDTSDKSKNWLDMFDVQFKTGGNAYNGNAATQIANTAMILKAYPNAKIKVGGYTDVTGNAESNIRISQTRADIVKADLLKQGATAAQITEAVGYGGQYAKAVSGDKEGLARDRKVAVKVASK